jgi:hypothetical protein
MPTASRFERETPESQGVESAAIAKLVEAGSQHAFHSLMALRHGKVIAECWWAPYNPARAAHDVLGLQDGDGDRHRHAGRGGEG